MTIFLLLMTMSGALAFTLDEDTFYSRSDTKSILQQTSLGETLQCSETADKSQRIENYKLSESEKVDEITFSCKGGLINKYVAYGTSITYNFEGEYSGTWKFQLHPYRNYYFECYYCPDNTICGVSDTYELVNDKSYVQCVKDGNVRVWEQTVCRSDEYVDTSSWSCVEPEPEVCYPDWKTTAWSDCDQGIQTRTVRDLNSCGTSDGKPTGSQTCSTPQCYSSNDCSSGEECNSGTCEKIIDLPTTTTCTNGAYACDLNDVVVCNSGTYLKQETCSEGCYIDADAKAKCIQKESIEGDNNTKIIISVLVLLIILVILAMFRKK